MQAENEFVGRSGRHAIAVDVFSGGRFLRQIHDFQSSPPRTKADGTASRQLLQIPKIGGNDHLVKTVDRSFQAIFKLPEGWRKEQFLFREPLHGPVAGPRRNDAAMPHSICVCKLKSSEHPFDGLLWKSPRRLQQHKSPSIDS